MADEEGDAAAQRRDTESQSTPYVTTPTYESVTLNP